MYGRYSRYNDTFLRAVRSRLGVSPLRGGL
jgi:hypothetical protein